jgi:hypothetical protein
MPEDRNPNIHSLLLAGSLLIYSSALKMKTVHSCDASVDFCRTTRSHIQENSILRDLRFTLEGNNAFITHTNN